MNTESYTEKLAAAISEEERRKHRSKGDMYWFHKGMCEGLEEAMRLLMDSRKKDKGEINEIHI